MWKKLQKYTQTTRLRTSIWKNFFKNRKTPDQRAKEYGHSIHWIRKELRAYEIPSETVTPGRIVALMDCVFFVRSSGYLVVRDENSGRFIYWKKIIHENANVYRFAREYLEGLGFSFDAVVIDGKPGTRKVFADIPVQMCLFHQRAIVNRYLTRKHHHQAGLELQAIMKTLCRTDDKSFRKALGKWENKWGSYLQEHSTDSSTRCWHYAHRDLYSAYHSIKLNLPFLFTYQKYPFLKIPDTINSLESSFSHLKDLIRVHRGLKSDLKEKLIQFFFQNGHRNL
jgi:hypothetical protein